MRKLALVLSALALMASTTAWAKAGVDVDVTLGDTGNYIYRGARLASTGLYGDLNAKYAITSRLSVDGNVWGYMYATRTGWVERAYDVSASYTPPWFEDLWTLTLGWTYNDNDNKVSSPLRIDDSQEAYLVAALNRPKWWSPWVSAHYDYTKQTQANPVALAAMRSVGLYIQGGVGKSFDLKSGWVADVSAKAGFDFGRPGNAGKQLDGFRDAVLHAGATWQLEKGLTFGPAVDLWFPSNQVNVSSFRPNASLGFSYNKTY